MVIVFQSLVALCAFAGLAVLLHYARRTTLVAPRHIAARPQDHIRTGIVLHSNGQASGPT